MSPPLTIEFHGGGCLTVVINGRRLYWPYSSKHQELQNLVVSKLLACTAGELHDDVKSACEQLDG